MVPGGVDTYTLDAENDESGPKYYMEETHLLSVETSL